MRQTISLIIKISILIILMICAVTSIITIIFTSPWSPTRKKDLKRIKKLIKAKKGDIIYELGCGDGRVCFNLAKNTQAKIIGIEFSFFYYLLAKIKLSLMKLTEKVKIIWSNLLSTNLENADCVFLYLTPKTLKKVVNKTLKNLKPNTRIISYQYQIPGWHYEKKDQPTKKFIPIYLYKVGDNLQQLVYEIN